VRGALAAPLLALAACRAPGPEHVLADYVAHLRAGRVAAAYALTTPSYRARHELAAFSLAVARRPLPGPGVVGHEVHVELANHDPPLELIGDRKHLVLTGDPLDLYPHDSPEATLRSFVRAVVLDRPVRVGPLLAPAMRERLAPDRPVPSELVEAARAIERSLRTTRSLILTDGQTARWLLGEGDAVGLERAPTGWWITSL
jgi:hypothetical protein